MKTLFIILALAFAISGQRKAPKGFEIRYDRFKDQTSIGFYDIGYGPTFTAWFQFDGKELAESINDFYFTFSGSRCPGYCYNNPTAIFILDDNEHIKLSQDVLADEVTFPISRDILTRLVAAKKIDFQVGSREGGWRDKNIGKLKTLLDLGTK